jgi:acyl-CoA hydrolase
MDKKDLGIYTELITSSMGKLMEAGVVTNERKNFHKGKTIGGIIWGDCELYRVLHHNPMIEMHPSQYVNDPFNIMKNDNLISINAAIEIDLTGQICSESVGTMQFSGTGGAFDFAYGAYRSKGGKGIIAVSSTAKGGTVSKIKPTLTPGSVVSISRNVADYVVTEYGVAKLRHKTIRERMNELIAIAHPDFREELKRQAEEMMIW